MVDDARKMLAQVPLDHQSLTDTERACLVAARRSVKAALEHSYRCTEARLLNRTIDVAWSRFVELGVNAGNMLRNGIHGSTPLRLVYIPAGEFMMGSPQNEPGRSDNEGPQHKVKIAKPFYMGVYAVTTEQWFSVMGNKYTVVPSGEPYPRTGITWEDACEFCRKLSQQTGRNFHLPTEAQREYACRAGSKTAYFYGEDPTGSRLNEFAWSIIGRENWKTRGSRSFGQAQAQRLGPLRHAGQCHGMVFRLLRRRLRRQRRHGPRRPRFGHKARGPRGADSRGDRRLPLRPPPGAGSARHAQPCGLPRRHGDGGRRRTARNQTRRRGHRKSDTRHQALRPGRHRPGPGPQGARGENSRRPTGFTASSKSSLPGGSG